MHKEQYSQLELFAHGSPQERLPEHPKSMDPGLREYVKLYEKAILIAIGFVVTGMIAFCCGVERGKKTALGGINARMDTAALSATDDVRLEPKPAPARAAVPADRPGVVTINGRIKDLPAKQEIILAPQKAGEDTYTVQIASYKSREGAEQESARLRKKGLSPVIVKKGGYCVLCVGAFTNKEKARSLLTELRSKYRDCYVRRL